MNITCKSCSEMLIDYHYGELSLELRAAVCDHLSDCGECARAFCRLHADLAGITEGVPAPDPALQARLRGMVEKEFSTDSWWQRLLRASAFPIPVYQTVLAIAAIAALWGLLATQTSTPPPAMLTDYDASRIITINPEIL